MTLFFCDSSALIKRYILERGSSWIEALMSPAQDHSFFVAQVTRAEIVSGLARLRREGALSSEGLELARQRINLHTSREYRAIALTEQVVLLAEALLLRHPLRAYDAIQLATALIMAARLVRENQPQPVFLSADRRLLAAAEAEGLAIDDPNRYP